MFSGRRGTRTQPSRFLDHRFSRPADYQLSHPSKNFVASGWIRTTDLQLMRLAS